MFNISSALSSLEIELTKNLEFQCNVKNCISCKTPNECYRCKENFTLSNYKCFSNKCEIYGFCKYCSEFECRKCLSGYKLEYGFCDELLEDKNILYYYVIPIFIIFLFIVFCIIKYIKYSRHAIISADVLNYRHPSAGSYIIVTPQRKEFNLMDNSINPTSASSTISNLGNDSPAEATKCVFCSKEKIFSFANCGCALCKEHTEMTNNEIPNEKLECPVHLTPITRTLYIKRSKKSTLKGNAIEQLGGTSMCYLCKIFPADSNYVCQCGTKLCSRCYIGNLYIFKINKCPGCGKFHDYNSDKQK